MEGTSHLYQGLKEVTWIINLHSGIVGNWNTYSYVNACLILVPYEVFLTGSCWELWFLACIYKEASDLLFDLIALTLGTSDRRLRFKFLEWKKYWKSSTALAAHVVVFRHEGPPMQWIILSSENFLKCFYSLQLFLLVRCTKFRFPSGVTLTLLSLFGFCCTFCFLCCCHVPSLFTFRHILSH